MALVVGGISKVRNLIGNLSTPLGFKYLAYGTGTTAEATTATALGGEADRQLANITIVSVVAPFDTVRYHYTFDVTTTVSCAEIGMFDATTAGNMLNRELLGTAISAAKNSKLLVAFDHTIK